MKNVPQQVDQSQLHIQASNRETGPRKETHYEKCPPPGRPKTNYNSKCQTGGPDPERRFIMKTVPEQVDQSPPTNPRIKHEDGSQKGDSL